MYEYLKVLCQNEENTCQICRSIETCVCVCVILNVRFGSILCTGVDLLKC